MSIGEAAREKIEAFAAGEIVEPEAAVGATAGEVADPADTGTPGAPSDEPLSGDPDQAPAVAPTAEEEEAAEDAADAAADALGEDATEEEREAARQEARDEFYAGTYRTREDAEAGIAEKDATLKRLFSEKNLLEQRLREVETQKEQETQEAEELDLPAWDAWAAEQVSAGAGETGAMAALKEGGYEGYQVYVRHWLAAETEDGEPDHDARAKALLFNNEVVMSIAEVRAAAASERARSEPSAAEIREQAHATVKAKRPDLDDYSTKMAEVVAELPEEDVKWLRGLAEQGVDGQAKALDWIYLETKSRGGAKTAAQDVERRRRRASADAATVALTSAAPEGVSSRTPPPAAEAEGLRRKRELRARQNLKIDDGLDAD